MSMGKRIVWLLAVVVILGGMAWARYAQVDTPRAPELTVTPASYDFGPVSQLSKTTFELKNTGNAPLNLLGVSTSCGCTQAWFERDTLLPGDTTPLHVSFDPNAHEGLEGEILRQVFLRTDARENAERVIALTATVVQEGAP